MAQRRTANLCCTSTVEGSSQSPGPPSALSHTPQDEQPTSQKWKLAGLISASYFVFRGLLFAWTIHFFTLSRQAGKGRQTARCLSPPITTFP
jgi:hypothetical protein